MLKKKDKLPVVAFTFSKKKIEENATSLQSLDLTTAKEKSEIHIFFHNSIKRLKGSDQSLPQVLNIESWEVIIRLQWKTTFRLGKVSIVDGWSLF